MSEAQTRPSVPRGRGSGRGGRGGYSSRGGRGARPSHPNGDRAGSVPTTPYEDEGELGQLKKHYSSKLSTIKEMFPDWTDEDIVFALQETDGDLESTIERISEGNISQWGEVKKKSKDRARSKVKELGADGADLSGPTRGRGRASDGARGGRGRATERGRGTGRGRGGPAANGTKKPAHNEAAAELPAAAADTSLGWDNAPDVQTEGLDQSKGGSVSPDADASSWEVVTSSEAGPPAGNAAPKPSLKPDGTRSWASMLKPAPKPKQPPVKPKTVQPSHGLDGPNLDGPASQIHAEHADAPTIEDSGIEISQGPQSPGLIVSDPVADLTPSKDELTETNLEQVQDTSVPIATETAASTTASNDPRSAAGSLTPLHASQQQTSLRPGLGGYAITAHKATSGSGRASSFSRRVKEQQEAVVMPGNHAVDRAAVQFGSMGLGGNEEDPDVDEEREDAETKAQPPQHSPVAPRASLPPAPQHAAAESAMPSTRPAPGLPSVAPQGMQPDSAAPQPTLSNYGYNQFNNMYGGATSQAEASAPAAKTHEPFGQQVAGHSYDGYASQSQAPAQHGHLAHQQQHGAFSAAGSDYPSYYSSDSQRNAYQQYYGSYGQQAQPTPQDTSTSQQRVGSGFGSSTAEQSSTSATSQAQQSSRFSAANEAQGSGNSTPNPTMGQQHGQAPAHPSQQMGQGHGQAGGHGAYPYAGHPSYYNTPYYSSYINQFGYGGSQGGYGSGPYGGAGKYGQPHQGYGVSAQSPYDPHSASPANTGAYGQQPHSVPSREGGSGLGGYGRTGSTQPSEGQSHSSAAFAGMSEVFNRSQSGYPSQSSQQQSAGQSSNDDTSRGYSDTSKIAGGPSPAPGQASVRPGSAANLQGQAGLPSSQGQAQQGYASGYPSHMSHQMQGQQSGYGSGLGSLGHHQAGGQSHQASGYGGGYGAGFGGNYYNNSSSRGGWGGNYGH